MTMPCWAERLRVRMIHELGGYTDEDVAKEIYEATCATPPCKEETFRIEEYRSVVALGSTAYAPADAKQIDSAKEAALLDMAKSDIASSRGWTAATP